jgi:hypothetical protein
MPFVISIRFLKLFGLYINVRFLIEWWSCERLLEIRSSFFLFILLRMAFGENSIINKNSVSL